MIMVSRCEFIVNTNLKETKPFIQWIGAGQSLGTIAPGESEEVEITMDAFGLSSGVYSATIEITSNDPINPLVEVPVEMTVDGAPDINVSTDDITFDPHFIGASTSHSINIQNEGSDPLNISSITASIASFQVSASSMTIEPGESADFEVTFAPVQAGDLSGILTFISDDPDEGTITINLFGTGVEPPVMSVNRVSITKTMFANINSTETIQLQNEGNHTLDWELAVAGSAGSTNSLEDVLERLNSDFSSINGIIPSRYDFSEGETGIGIDDGGYDMYDGGNYLLSNLGSYLNYSNKSVISSAFLGTGGKYFTAKYPGLFVLAADISSLSYFEITGNLGADGSGSTDGTVLTLTKNGTTFKGFVKRVYSSGDPSVNHLIIIEDNGTASHNFSSDTNNDQHRLENLAAVTRIYYLLYGGTVGYYINNDETRNIMQAFLNIADDGADWLTPSLTEGELSANSNQSVSLSFNTAELEEGDYEATLIFTGNDPITPQIDVPVTLHVVPFVNNNPVVTEEVGSQNVAVGGSLEVNLALHISDPDGHALSYSASLSDETKADYSIAGSVLQLSGVAEGVTTVTVTATDIYEGSVSLTFDLSVTAQPNQAPVLSLAIPPMSMEKETTIEYGLEETFSDPENDALSYTAESSNTSLATISIQNATLTITGVEVGEATVFVTATDPFDKAVSTSFKLSVLPVNHAPELTEGFTDVTVTLGDPKTEIDLAGHFTDSDGDQLAYTISLSAIGIITASINAAILELNTVAEGESVVTIEASDAKGKSIQASFKVMVVSPNLPPVLVNSVEDMHLTIGDPESTLILADYFDDPENDDLAYSVELSVEGILETSISSSNLLILNALTTGEATVTLTAQDSHSQSVQTSFVVTVEENHAPSILAQIANIERKFDDPEVEIDLSMAFTDEDGDALLYSLILSSSEIVHAQIGQNKLIIQPIDPGQATIEIIATDPRGLSVSQTVDIKITGITGLGDLQSEWQTHYPNPFSSELTFSYILERDGYVHLSVFDLQGKEIENVVNEWQTQGEHDAVLKADTMAAGQYLYRLKAGEKVIQGKITKLN